jgi:hypothetical protein
VDGDGHIDLLAASFGENSVKVLPGTGNGSFGSALAYPTNGHPAFPLGLGDVNGDGEADIVVVTSIDGDPSPGYSIEVLFGRGDGGFLTPISSDAVAPHSSDAVVADLAFGAIGDLNGDRVPDVVIGTSTHDLDWQMTILLGKPDGTFARGVDYAADTGSNTVAIGDVNRDGAVDIVTDGELGNAVVWLGAGDGTFLSLDRLPVAQDASCCGGNINNSSRLIDLNGDGALDFVVDVNDRITVLLGRGDGSFACRESYAVDNLPSNFALGDLNHDGRLDLVTTAGAVATIFLASH